MLTPSLWRALRPRTFEITGYTFRIFGADILAGLTVGVVAIPLALAFAIASGVKPEQGLITAIVAGFFISFLGGSRTQIGGPTGAFIVVLYGIVQSHGYGGLVLATLMAGLLLMTLGFLRLGKYIRLIPAPVVIGFTAGIAIIIFSGQVRDFFGLPLTNLPADAPHQWLAYAHVLGNFSPMPTAIGLMALGIIIICRGLDTPIPPAILAVIVCTAATWWLDLPVTTIGSKFGGIPQQLPHFQGSDIYAAATLNRLRELIPSALTIAFLAGIESLLSALVADKLSNDHHKPDTELIAQGVANIASVLLGGIAATGAIARTGVNIRAGAHTPVAGMVHALFLLAVMLTLAPLANHIPLAVLAAVLFVTAWDMSEKRHIPSLLKGPRLHLVMFTATLAATVLVDLTTGVALGIFIAMLGHFHGRLTTRNIPV
jgi:SulP family sulfate permease